MVATSTTTTHDEKPDQASLVDMSELGLMGSESFWKSAGASSQGSCIRLSLQPVLNSSVAPLPMSGAPGEAAQSERLRKALERFHDDVRTAARMPIEVKELARHDGPRNSILWLEICSSPSTTSYYRPSITSSLESLELFALLARVDWKLWTQVAEEIWPELSTRSGVCIQDLAPVTVGIDVKMRRYQDIEDVDPTPYSHYFPTERGILISALPEEASSMVEIPIRVSLQYEWNRLDKIVEILTKQQRVDENIVASTRYKGIRIDSIKFELWGFVLGRPPVRLLMDAVARGLHVVDFGLMKWDVFHDDPKLYLKTLHTLFAIDCPQGDAPLRGVEDFKHLHDMRYAMVPSVYSAVAASPTVRCVEVDFSSSAMPKHIRPLALSWLAYAVFRREAGLQKLSLCVDAVMQGDLDTMDTILDACDPLHELLDQPASLRGATVSAKRFSLFDPIAAGRVLVRGDYESTHELNHLPVVERTKEWRTVLLPGWGRAWVHRRDILGQKKASTRSTAARAPSIPEMAITRLNPSSADTVLRLLERVGSGIQRLTIEGFNAPEEPFPDAWLSRLFQVCPRLESLVLHRTCINSLQVLLDGYVSGTCRLKSLKLLGTYFADVNDAVGGFIAALGDRTHPIATRLEEFVCHRSDWAVLLIPDIAIKLATMLEQNRRLSILDIKAPRVDLTREHQMLRSMGPMLAFNNQRLGYRKTRWNSKRQAAFLSVVGNSNSHAMEMLDARVLALIFELAGSDQRRYVSVSFGV